MPAGWDAVYNFIAGNVWAATTVLLALIGAALTAYAREQVRAGTDWALRPIGRLLPWNHGTNRSNATPALSSAFTLVQVFLLDASGCRARYEKTTSFAVNRPTISYLEAVTAEHAAAGFTTMRGTINETLVERGFYVSRIDLGNTVGAGERVTNVYSADLLNSFSKPREHWTQEFTYPTDHLSLQIHFPADRPPKSLACRILDGASEKPADGAAQLVDLFGQRSIVWEVTGPKLHQAVKLEWTW